jgi:hypothetical protein
MFEIRLPIFFITTSTATLGASINKFVLQYVKISNHAADLD